MGKVSSVTYLPRKMLDSRRLIRKSTKIGAPLFRGKDLVENLQSSKAEAVRISNAIKAHRVTNNNSVKLAELEKELVWVNHLAGAYQKKIDSLKVKRKTGWRAAVRVGLAGPTAAKRLRNVQKIRKGK